MQMRLSEGTTLIVDRYSFSGIAYSVAKVRAVYLEISHLNIKQGLSWAECTASEVGLVAPDLVFFLDLTPEEAAKRSEYGLEIYETVEFHQKVHEAYKQLARHYNWIVSPNPNLASPTFTRLQVIDANKHPNNITQLILDNIKPHLLAERNQIELFTLNNFDPLVRNVSLP